MKEYNQDCAFSTPPHWYFVKHILQIRLLQLDPKNDIVSFCLVLFECNLDDLIFVHFCTLHDPSDGEIQIHPNVEVYLCVVFESAQSRYD